MTVTIRDVQPSDHDAWVELYAGYRDFYHLTPDPDAVEITWGWVSTREHGMRGLVAEDSTGQVIALANLRTFARPSAGRLALYLDDLFTGPAARGTGAGTALLHRIAELAADEGAVLVRWNTAADNVTARRVYDKVATVTDFVLYDMAPAAPVPTPPST